MNIFYVPTSAGEFNNYKYTMPIDVGDPKPDRRTPPMRYDGYKWEKLYVMRSTGILSDPLHEDEIRGFLKKALRNIRSKGTMMVDVVPVTHDAKGWRTNDSKYFRIAPFIIRDHVSLKECKRSLEPWKGFPIMRPSKFPVRL